MRTRAWWGVVALASFVWFAPQARADALRQPGPASPPNTVAIAWFHDLYEAHKRSVETGRPMVIVFGASWCHYCREMESTTLRNGYLAEYITANFIPVHLDKDRDKRVADILKVKPIPCTVILSPDAQVLGTVLGYQEVAPYQAELEKSRQHYLKLQQRRK